MPRPFQDPDQLTITLEYRPDGVSFRLRFRDGRKEAAVELPLGAAIRQYVGQREAARLALLDSLWEEEVLSRPDNAGPGTYLLATDAVYGLDTVDRVVLRLPEPAEVQVSLRSIGAVGMSAFAIQARVRHPQLGMLHQLANRTGPFFVFPTGQAVMVNPAVVRLLDELDRRPDTPADQPEYLARVSALAAAAGAALDPYLAAEEYILVDEVELEPELKAPDHLVLHPRLPGVPPEAQADLEQRLPAAPPYLALPGPPGQRRRVFLSPGAREKLRAWRERREIRGTEVPRFLQNPAPFLPEWVDLFRFSERVKGLVVRVYTAHPYLRAERKDRGWFDLEPVIRLEESSLPGADEQPPDDRADANREGVLEPQGSAGTDSATPELDLEEFSRLVEAARARNEDYVLWNGVWVQVPRSAERFVEATAQMYAQCPDGRVDLLRLPYILDIYTNIDDLEYSQDLIEHEAERAQLESGDEPPGFAGTLMPHQREGLVWLKRLTRQRLGGLLADDMGLGKTVQVLAYMAFLHERGQLRPSLVVLPRAVWENWAAELRRFCPHLRMHAHGGPGRASSPERLSQWDVVLTTYETLARDQLLLGQIDWRLVVCDEAQKIKNMTALATNAAKALKARTRLAMTGTPVENNLGELWCITDFAQPGLMGSYQEFRRHYEVPLRGGDTESCREVERQLVWQLRPIYKRRTKWEHLKDVLPEKREEKLVVALSKAQRELYLSALRQARGQKGAAPGALHRLLQTCCHPALPDNRWVDIGPRALLAGVPKLQATLEILDRVRSAGEKALVITHWKGMQQILQRVIWDRYQVYPKVINGESADRKALVDQFCATPGFSVMIISPKAGGVGLNLVCANHVIHYSRWWNPAVENQATDRVYRIGQTRPVTVYFPIVTDSAGATVEEILDDLLEEKRQLAASVIIPSSALEISQAEVASRLGLEF